MLYIRYYVWVTYNYEQRHLYRNVHVPQPLVNDTHTHTQLNAVLRGFSSSSICHSPPHHSTTPPNPPPPHPPPLTFCSA